mmetsp:Transcript_19931/g.60232  ORF Transcript_19931/g.60232 Transcript_19931/m.60232 type:complete len:292 (+) Transcript_19931:1868-2743(+)
MEERRCKLPQTHPRLTHIAADGVFLQQLGDGGAGGLRRGQPRPGAPAAGGPLPHVPCLQLRLRPRLGLRGCTPLIGRELGHEGGGQDIVHDCTGHEGSRHPRSPRHVQLQVVQRRHHIREPLLHLLRRQHLAVEGRKQHAGHLTLLVVSVHGNSDGLLHERPPELGLPSILQLPCHLPHIARNEILLQHLHCQLFEGRQGVWAVGGSLQGVFHGAAIIPTVVVGVPRIQLRPCVRPVHHSAPRVLSARPVLLADAVLALSGARLLVLCRLAFGRPSHQLLTAPAGQPALAR